MSKKSDKIIKKNNLKLRGILDIGEVKKIYLESKNVAVMVCPYCGFENIRDFGEHYFSYVRHNDIEENDVWCEKCEKEFSIKVKLRCYGEVEIFSNSKLELRKRK